MKPNLASRRLARRALCVLPLALLALVTALGAAEQPLAPRAGWDSGWHVVRPGDTLERLAQRFLGSNEHWKELHALNPGLPNPHYLVPGQRLRIWLARPSAVPNAQVEAVAGKVEERPSPVPWRPAAEGDLLLERDGMRTFDRGSSRLRFDDGVAVTLTENSLVFIRHQSPVGDPEPTREIEIQTGQADIETAASGPSPEIEIVLGEARGRASSAGGGPVHARSSAERAGGSRLMIYRGQGEVAAAGTTVALPEGTGTSVAPRQAPKPAETLLPAPALGVPAADGELGLDDPVLTWEPVAAAAAYTVEVCADAGCASLVERTTGVTEARYRLLEPPAAAGFWRVTAASASGLDGYPATARRFTPVESVGPPAPSIALVGGDGAELPPEARVVTAPAVEVTATDRYGRPLPWALVVDGRELPPGAVPFRRSGRYQVGALARDTRGRSARSVVLPFLLDRTDPWTDLPAIPDVRTTRSLWRMPSRTPGAVCGLGLEYSTGGESWTPIPCADQGDAVAAIVELTGTAAALQVRSAKAARLGDQLPLREGRPVALRVGDIGSGLAEAQLRVVRDPARDATPSLEVVTVDRSGRRGRNGWRLEAR